MFPAHVLHHRNAPDVLEYFFFTDTATADIYTLSLHDALPILILGTGERPLRFPSMIIQLHRLLKNRDGGGILDRKSTRLNSSHTVISYAVFCLKKKKHHVGI